MRDSRATVYHALPTPPNHSANSPPTKPLLSHRPPSPVARRPATASAYLLDKDIDTSDGSPESHGLLLPQGRRLPTDAGHNSNEAGTIHGGVLQADAIHRKTVRNSIADFGDLKAQGDGCDTESGYLFCSLGCSVYASAQIRLPKLFSDHAVLQRVIARFMSGAGISPDKNVRVRLGTETGTAPVDDLGHWNLWLMPMTAGGPYVLSVEDGQSRTTFEDIYLGDVWVASGQSNMQMPPQGVSRLSGSGLSERNCSGQSPGPALADGGWAPLRVFQKRMFSPDGWKLSSPESAAPFSAVAYFLQARVG